MGLFSKHKDNVEQATTNDIKQAAISDTQTSSLGQSSAPLGNNTSTSSLESEDFQNPFAQGQNNSMEQNNAPLNTGQQVVEQNATPNNSDILAQNPSNAQQINVNPDPLSQPPVTEQQVPQNDPFGGMSLGNNNNSGLSKEEITELIDETVEKLIEEKWENMIENVNKIIKWKEKTDSEIHMLKEDIVAINDGFQKLESKLVGKISNYDKDILDVSSEIKALEKVFQKITPTLINNVNELSKIADDFKDMKPNKKSSNSDDDVVVKRK